MGAEVKKNSIKWIRIQKSGFFGFHTVSIVMHKSRLKTEDVFLNSPYLMLSKVGEMKRKQVLVIF